MPDFEPLAEYPSYSTTNRDPDPVGRQSQDRLSIKAPLLHVPQHGRVELRSGLIPARLVAAGHDRRVGFVDGVILEALPGRRALRLRCVDDG